MPRLSGVGCWALVAALALQILAAVPGPALADDLMEAKQLVEKAKWTADNFTADPNMEGLRDLASRAKGVFIAPQVLRGAFIFGASGGSGVLVVRDEKTGQWVGPTFSTMGEASFGLQIGGEASEVVLVAMTDRGVTALLSHSVKLGADANIAVGPIGAGASAATANLSADIISFSRSKGLYGGVSVQGAVVASRDGWNKAYYGADVTPTDILIRQTVANPHAAGLLQAVAKMASRT